MESESPHDHLSGFLAFIAQLPYNQDGSSSTSPALSSSSVDTGRSPIYNSFAFSPRRTSRIISTERVKVLENLRQIQSKDNDDNAKFTSFIVYMLGGESWSQNPQQSMEWFMEALNSIHKPEASASASASEQIRRHFWDMIGVDFSIDSLEDLCCLPSTLYSKVNEKNGNNKKTVRRSEQPIWKRPKLSSGVSYKNESRSQVYTILGYVMTHALACDTSFTADISLVNSNNNNENDENLNSNTDIVGWEEFTSMIQHTANQSGFISKKMHCLEHCMFQVGSIMYALDCMEFSTEIRDEQVNEGLLIEQSEGTRRGLKILHCLSFQHEMEIDLNVGSIIKHLKMDW